MFRASSVHLQEDIDVYKQHMVPSLSIRVPGGLFFFFLNNNLFSNMLRYTVTLHVPVCLFMAK